MPGWGTAKCSTSGKLTHKYHQIVEEDRLRYITNGESHGCLVNALQTTCTRYTAKVRFIVPTYVLLADIPFSHANILHISITETGEELLTRR